jgi:CBS-domain-containing membrane protein/PII-like signaling protein
MTMTIHYSIMEIFTSEEARFEGRPVHEVVTDRLRALKIGARCMVLKGIEGGYETGERVTRNILSLSFNMPIKIEILLPTAELTPTLSALKPGVTEGVVATRDIHVHHYKISKRLLPRHLRVQDIMSDAPCHVAPETTVDRVVDLLLNANFRGLPVVARDGTVTGIITQQDLIDRAGLSLRLGLVSQSDAATRKELFNGLSRKQARVIMSSPAITVRADAFVSEAVDTMLTRGKKRLPVIDTHNQLVGMVSRIDIFQAASNASPDWKRLDEHLDITNARTVADIMHRDAQTVTPESPVEEVIRIIDTDRIQRVSVVDHNNRFLGLIADSDLLAAFSGHGAIGDYLSALIPFQKKGERHRLLQHALQQTTAGDVMKTDLVTVQEASPIEDALRLMADHGLKRIPVLDREGCFKGMVSREEVLRVGFGPA